MRFSLRRDESPAIGDGRRTAQSRKSVAGRREVPRVRTAQPRGTPNEFRRLFFVRIFLDSQYFDPL